MNPTMISNRFKKKNSRRLKTEVVSTTQKFALGPTHIHYYYIDLQSSSPYLPSDLVFQDQCQLIAICSVSFSHFVHLRKRAACKKNETRKVLAAPQGLAPKQPLQSKHPGDDPRELDLPVHK